MSNRLHTDFLTAKGAQNLLRFADEALRTLSPDSQNTIAQYICQILGTLGWTISRFPDARGGIDPAEYYRGSLLFFRKYTEDLQDPAKVTDASAARELIIHFSLLIQEICQWDEDNAMDLANELLEWQDADLPTVFSLADTQTSGSLGSYRQYPDILPVLVANVWKFKLLRKYIIKGRMELRVMSIVLMDGALVEVYKEYRDMDPPNQHPVLQYLADVLLRGRVVDYIISVDSHPQLISRSGNIAGFLVVTNRWADSQADAIWSTVSHNPDPRVVTATMTMLRNIINLMNPSDHLYLCMKIHDLPIESFTLDILRFLRELTARLLDRHPPVDWTLRDDSARPWNVCVRLLQETAPRNGATKHDLDLHAEADDQLRRLAQLIPGSDRRTISQRCLEYITGNSVSATGSVRVIFILASFGDVVFLQQDESMVRRVLEEVPSFVKSESQKGSYSCQLPALQYRLELLAFLVCRLCQLVPEDLYVELWDHVIGPHALSNLARDGAWAQLLQATKLSPNNEFCRQLITTYVPTMDPQYYTPGLYEFVVNYNFPITRKMLQIDGEMHSLLQIPGGDLLWSLALSSPQDTIEAHAARELAARYIQIAQSREVTLPEVEVAHVELIERCMRELRSAFETIQKGSSERKDDSRVRFGRILMFQKQMLELVRQKPEFNRARRADSKVGPMDINLPATNAITIRYQFGNDRQSISITPNRTIADLHRSLCQATGCSKINLFAGGRKLDIAQQADVKVIDANLGGQLLVQPIQRSETTQVLHAPVAGHSEFETNLVKHFDEMFNWMDIDVVTSHLVSIVKIPCSRNLC
jgi:ubiquitin carboxyl-terminal hydrolase 34